MERRSFLFLTLGVVEENQRGTTLARRAMRVKVSDYWSCMKIIATVVG